MSDGNGALPEGWAWAKVDDLRQHDAPIIYGILQPGPEQEEGVYYVRPTEIVNDIIQVANLRKTTQEIAEKYKRASLKCGDTLLSIVGTIGKVASVPPELEGANITQSSVRIRTNDECVEAAFVRQALKAPPITQQFDKRRLGTGVPRLNVGHVRELDIPLPPLAEQRRIVSKIESLQERSSRARRALSEVGPLLEQFRQSVLRAAFSGRLTADWRAAHPDVEPATELLARIRTERRHRWEQSELAKYKAKGKQPPKNWQDKYKEPQPINSVEISELQAVVIGKPTMPPPEGWVWAPLVEVAELESGHTPRKTVPEYWDGGDVPWISLKDIRAAHGKVITETGMMPTMLGIENSSSRLLPEGTVCFSRDISVGFVTIMGREMATTQHFANWICGASLDNKFLMYAFMAARNSLVRSGEGTTVRTIYMPALNRLHVLLPSIDEQKEIVARIEERNDAIVGIGGELAGMESALTELDQSILAKAFRGELVPQDPRDEPASELLARIRQTREAAAATSKPRGRSKRAARQASQPAAKSSPDEPHGGTEASREPVRGKSAETQIPVLTIKQPWADHIIFGNKWCENRSWTTPYRGPLYIHAGMSWDADGGGQTPGNGQHGAILGRVNLVDVLDLEELGMAEVRRIARKYGLSTASAAMQHVTGRYCWTLTEPQALKQPIETPGKLKIWKFDAPQHSLAFHKDRMAAVTEPATSTVQAAVTEPAKPADKPAVADSPRPMDDYTRDELMAVIRDVFTSGGSRSRDQAIHDIADALSFTRVGHRIREAIDNSIRTAVRRGILDSEHGELSLLCRHIDEYTRDHLIDILLAAMGTGWWEQSEAIRTATGHLGYRRTGQNIEKAFKGAINAAIRRNLLERNGQELRRIR
ncbi:MAG: restriction endonuclease subunit S [Fuerstiella sp.]